MVNCVTLIAPPFFEVEADTVIRKRVHDSRLSLADAQKAFAGLDKVTVQLCTHPHLRQRTVKSLSNSICGRFTMPDDLIRVRDFGTVEER